MAEFAERGAGGDTDAVVESAPSPASMAGSDRWMCGYRGIISDAVFSLQILSTSGGALQILVNGSVPFDSFRLGTWSTAPEP
jgi:hypothetical protein